MSITIKENGLLKRSFAQLQKIGKSLLFPVAMLPIAAILLRLGAAIPQTTEFSKFIASVMLAVGNGVFGPALPILFAIGIAFGMTNDQRGEAAITGFAVMVVMSGLLSDNKGIFGGADIVEQVYGNVALNGGKGFHAIFGGAYNNILANNVFTGIFAGSVVAFLYNRFNGLELPSVLGFFSGRRLIPVLALMTSLFVGIAYALIFPWLGVGLFYIGKGMGEAQGSRWANAGIMGGYGIINRLLIPFGLHHAINIPLWFTEVGGTYGEGAAQIAGDINIFAKAAAEGNNSGTFQAGFFPTMMFGLPAIAAAIWFNAKGDKQKAKVASMLFGAAVVSFFTGITEPLEFSFMFVAPVLYIAYALMTGIFGFIVGAFGIQLGFGFSAGLIDYVLSIPKSLEIIKANRTGASAVMAHPVWMWVIGSGAFVSFFAMTHVLINKLDISTPGRKDNLLTGEDTEIKTLSKGTNKYTKISNTIIDAVGMKNIKSFSNCATRLRFVCKDNKKINTNLLDDNNLKYISVTGGFHIIMGPTVEMYTNEIENLLKKR